MTAGVLVLAAGGSSRFGSPKQLAMFQGKTLLEQAVRTALEARLGPVVAVLGAVDQPCREVLSGMDVLIVHHPGWETGMAGSIRAGLEFLMAEQPEGDGVAIMLADQPALTPGHLRALRAAAGNQSRIVASSYGDQAGVPAWFPRKYFPDLLQLEGNRGAKGLIARTDGVITVPLPETAAWDVDVPEDLAKLDAFPAGPP